MFCVALNIFPDRKKNPQVACPKSIALSNYWNVNYWEDLANNFGIIFRTHKRQLNFLFVDYSCTRQHRYNKKYWIYTLTS